MIDRLFRSLAITHPKTGTIDVMITLLVFAVVVCAIKFFLSDMTIVLANRTITFGHVDPFSFSSFLAPMFGAHGYMSGQQRQSDNDIINNGSCKVDDPDCEDDK
jgi:hypothetical protein